MTALAAARSRVLVGAAAVLASILCGIVPTVSAQEAFPRGEIVERLRAGADSTQTYALYLPSRYEPTRRWPVLFLMDPRGRALVPLGLFREAAEEHGYILLSSYDTRSDGPRKPNETAIQAMASDALSRLSIDTNRLYLAGFSGTAREAWEFASRIPDHVAGVIGFGAGLQGAWLDRARALSGSRAAYFGGGGTTDFNYEELRALDAALDEIDIPHRLEYFAGGHQWAPAHLCRRAVAWMELQAMRAGLRAQDNAWVEASYAEWLQQARSLEESGRPYEADEAYRYLAADFAGLRDVSEAVSRAQTLEKSEVVRAAKATLAEMAARRSAFDDELMLISAELAWKEVLPSVTEARSRLGLDRLQAEARSATDTLRAQGAQRQLENAFVQLAYYTPLGLLQRGKPELALPALDIADAIKPGNPRVCWFRARAFAQAGRASEALEQIACLTEAGVTEAVALDEDLYLEPLRSDPRYLELLRRMRPGGP